MDYSPLDYYTPARRRKPGNTALANALATWSLACLGLPAAGFIFRVGPLFLCGGLLAPLLGMALAMGGLISDRRAAGICGAALGINALVGAYFGWLIFVDGLC
jgi:hypothetical protein